MQTGGGPTGKGGVDVPPPVGGVVPPPPVGGVVPPPVGGVVPPPVGGVVPPPVGGVVPPPVGGVVPPPVGGVVPPPVGGVVPPPVGGVVPPPVGGVVPPPVGGVPPPPPPPPGGACGSGDTNKVGSGAAEAVGAKITNTAAANTAPTNKLVSFNGLTTSSRISGRRLTFWAEESFQARTDRSKWGCLCQFPRRHFPRRYRV